MAIGGGGGGVYGEREVHNSHVYRERKPIDFRCFVIGIKFQISLSLSVYFEIAVFLQCCNFSEFFGRPETMRISKICQAIFAVIFG